MTDELNKLADKADAMTADDAVTNRSDDTALEDDSADTRASGVSEAEVGQSDGASSTEAANVSSREQTNVSSTEDVIERDAAEEAANEAIEEEGQEEEEQIDEESVDDEASEEESSPDGDADSTVPARKRAGVSLEPEPAPEEIRMDWYILKVQSNRERSIAEALERKVRVEGLDRFFDQVIVPTEKVTEFKGGKKKIVERKLYPGYIVVHMHINDDTWFAVRETSGVGDFTGAGGKPTPMLAHEVARIVQTEEEETSESPKLDIKFAVGDKVKVKEGNFENFEGDVGTIDEASGRVTVMINIFGRSTPVELEYWQIEAV